LKWGSRRADGPPVAPPASPAPADAVVTSKVFPRFLAAVGHQESPALLDLGPVVGSNVSFFGDRFACKLYVEDLYLDIEDHARRGDRAALAQFFATRLTQPPNSIDGILCWDLFDFLDRAAGQVLAARLAGMVRKGGALYGSFGTTPMELKQYTKNIVMAEDSLKHRVSPATPVARTVLLTRDIIKMFDGLIVAESVLLKSSTRETLFRRP
ncbi:MAG: hypothetical protein WCQ64_15520, partial [Acidobacteriota bacterium]